MDIIIHNHYQGNSEEVLKLLTDANKNLLIIIKNQRNMATVDEVTTAVATLSQHITDAEARITAKDDALQATIDALKAQIAAGGATPEQLQTIVDGITAADTSVQTIDPAV